MKQYQPRFQECPFKTASGKCTHKHIKKRVSERKRKCGYSKPKHCEMYLEWVEISNVSKLKEKTIFTHSKPLNRLNLKRSKK